MLNLPCNIILILLTFSRVFTIELKRILFLFLFLDLTDDKILLIYLIQHIKWLNESGQSVRETMKLMRNMTFLIQVFTRSIRWWILHKFPQHRRIRRRKGCTNRTVFRRGRWVSFKILLNFWRDFWKYIWLLKLIPGLKFWTTSR
jgi:hypothetical protein